MDLTKLNLFRERQKLEAQLREVQTERDRLLDERARQEQRIQTLQECLRFCRIPVLWLRPDASVAYVNPATCESLGYTDRELTAFHLWDLDSNISPKVWESEIWPGLVKDPTKLFHTHQRCKDGSLVAREVHARYVKGAGEEYVLAFLFPTAQAQPALEKAGRLAVGVAHEFNNLLTVINGYTELLLVQSGRGPDNTVGDQLRHIREAGRKAAELAQQLLAFGRERGIELDQPPEPESSGPSEEEEEMAPPPGNLGAGQTVLVVEDQREVRRFAVSALSSLGYQVLEAEDGHSALAIWREHRGRIALLLTDVVMPGLSGRVLAEQLLGQDPNLKVIYMSGYSDDQELQKHLTQAGAAWLPKPFTAGELGWALHRALKSESKLAQILVVDDDPAVQRFLKDVLAGAGYQVHTANDGKSAIETLRRVPVDLMLLDLVMPNQEGLETLMVLRKEKSDLKVIAISGAFGGRFLQSAALLGAAATLRKPVGPDELLKKVAEVLGGKS